MGKLHQMKKLVKATEKNIQKAAQIIKNGGVVAFPTETVYGLGADVFNKKAVAKIFEIKKRPDFDPLIVHICDIKQLKLLCSHIPLVIKKITKLFWPGPLTVILPKKKSVPDIVTAGLKTVAVRMPENKIALKLIKLANTPIAAPSANLFSRLSPIKAEHVVNQLNGKPDLILDGGKTKIGLESTIIKYENGKLYLLRPGGLEKEKIENKIGVKIELLKNDIMEAPGQFKKHYSPKIKTIMVKDPSMIKSDMQALYIAFKKPPNKKFKKIKILSSKGDLEEAATNLFDFLHYAENLKIKRIYIETVPEKGLGLAINDRIKRAAADD